MAVPLKPRRLWRGNDLKVLHKVQDALEAIHDRDEREEVKAATQGATAFLFADASDPAVFQALEDARTLLLDRVQTCLALKTQVAPQV